MNVALIGYGYWGINLARTLTETEGLTLVSIFDSDLKRLSVARENYIFASYDTYDELLSSPSIDAVCIATPPKSHFSLARKALLAGKHVFVEKPFTLNLEDAYALFELADRRNLTIMTDHVFMFAEPVRYLKNSINDFGDIVYINSRRINLGLFQYTTDVIWDLAVHDLSIIDYLVGLDIKKVSTYKKKYQNFPNEALANIDLELMSDVVVNINVSWLSPVKVREMIIGGTEMTAIYDDTKPEKVALYEAGVVLEKELERDELYRQMVQYKYGEVIVPELPKSNSLNNALEHFRDSIRHKTLPISGRESTLRIIKALEIISKVG